MFLSGVFVLRALGVGEAIHGTERHSVIGLWQEIPRSGMFCRPLVEMERFVWRYHGNVLCTFDENDIKTIIWRYYSKLK